MPLRRLMTCALTATALVSATPSALTAKAVSSKCVTVSPSTLAAIGIPSAGAVKAKGKMGANHPGAWYVAAPGGPVWAVNTNPATADFGGLILPMNDAARHTSDAGTGIRRGAPVYGTLRATAREIKAARKCAS